MEREKAGDQEEAAVDAPNGAPDEGLSPEAERRVNVWAATEIAKTWGARRQQSVTSAGPNGATLSPHPQPSHPTARRLRVGEMQAPARRAHSPLAFPLCRKAFFVAGADLAVNPSPVCICIGMRTGVTNANASGARPPDGTWLPARYGPHHRGTVPPWQRGGLFVSRWSPLSSTEAGAVARRTRGAGPVPW